MKKVLSTRSKGRRRSVVKGVAFGWKQRRVRSRAVSQSSANSDTFVDVDRLATVNHVRLDDIDSYTAPAAVFRPLSSALETDDVALNYFELEAGDSFGYCYHRHREQEEVFVVLAGTATFETETGDVVVDTDEAIRFTPGEWQRGWNRGDDRVVALALGAPREQGPTDLRRECEHCGEKTPHEVVREDDAVVTRCLDCERETGRYE